MTHYICTGNCKAVSDQAGVCQASDCKQKDHELEPCECTDGKHDGKQNHPAETEETSE